MKLPIRIRLAAAYCAVFLVVIAALEAGVYVSVRAAIHSIVDYELQTRLAGLDDHLSRHLVTYAWPQLSDSLQSHPAFQPNFLSIHRANGELLMQGQGMRGLRISDYPPKPRVETADSDGHVLRVLSVRRKILGQDYDLALSTDLLMPSAILQRLWLLALGTLPLVMLIASAAGYWISGRALAPVSEIIAAARSIDSTRLNERIAVPPTGDEIQSLAETVNGMLARIEDGFRQVRQFTANASHELRTPVAIIRAAAEVALLRPQANAAAYQDALHRILREAERNSRLLEEMLQLARADSGVDRMRRERVPLGGSVAQACARMAPLAEAKGLRVSIRGERGPRLVDANEEHLRRLWLILLDNAVKYTPSEGMISVAVEETEDGRPRCTIADTGIGIAPEHLPKIFERFYRVDKARSRSEGGAGLGLSIAMEIAKLHGAEIDVESEPGRGSAFHVTFPAPDGFPPAAKAGPRAAVPIG